MRPLFTWLLVFTIAAAPTLVEASNTPQRQSDRTLQMRNVELTQDGQLRVQVLTESGLPGLATVSVHSQQDVKAVSQVIKTSASGEFAVKGLKNGRCVFTIGNDAYACRVWSHGTAPPKSLQTVAVVPSTSVVLGQNHTECQPRTGIRGRLACMTGTQKALLVGVVAAAIIIPIALDDDDDAS